MMVTVPLIVDSESGVNDYLDRDGSRTPVQFHISNDRDRHPVEAQIVQAATKWKRMALQRFGMGPGEGLCTDMRAVRKDYFLDHDHSAYVDQWDWEAALHSDDRNLEFLKRTVNRIWKVIVDAEEYLQNLFPQLKTNRYPNLPRKLTFLHAEDILDMYPDLPRKQRETAILRECPAVFIIGIGWTLQGRISARDARGGLRRLVDRDAVDRWPAMPWIKRRHPGVELRHEAAARAFLDGDPGHRGNAAEATRIDGTDGFSAISLSPGDSPRPDSAFDRRRDRAVADPDAAAPQGAPGRSDRQRVAEDPERDLRPEEYPRAGVSGQWALRHEWSVTHVPAGR